MVDNYHTVIFFVNMQVIARKDMKRLNKLFIQMRLIARDISDIYQVCGFSDNVNFNDKIHKLEQLVNQTFPQTSEEKTMQQSLKYLMRFGRPKLTQYLFETRQASLLLLIDGVSIARALGIYDILMVQDSSLANTNRYVIVRHMSKNNEHTLTKRQKRNKRTHNINSI